jgi:hypothetical protein
MVASAMPIECLRRIEVFATPTATAVITAQGSIASSRFRREAC